MLKNSKVNFHLFSLMIIFFTFSFSACEPVPDEISAKEVANRLNVDPSWNAIMDYFINDAFHVGMTREEVHQILDKVGPWVVDFQDPITDKGWSPNGRKILYREQIHFIERNALLGLGYWDFRYDVNGILCKFGPIDYA